MSHPISHRVTLAAYIRDGRHMLTDDKAKTIRQIAEDAGMSTTTVRHWLKVDHYDVWLDWWPSVEALWEEWQKNKPALAPMNFDLPDVDAGAIAAADDVR